MRPKMTHSDIQPKLMEGSLSQWACSVKYVILVTAEFRRQHTSEAEAKGWQRIVVNILKY